MNPVKDKLRHKNVTLGSWMQIPSIAVAEIMGKAGYDWVAIDLEHGSFSLDILPVLCLALENGKTVPFARLAQAHPKDIKQALDAGVKGLILPNICTKEELEEAVSWSYYPPHGTRGVGYSRANLFGKRFEECIPTDSKELVIVAQIEQVKAIGSLDKILTVDQLDAIIVGPYDLSASMGLTGLFEHTDFKAAMKEIQEKAEGHGISMGLHIVKPDPYILNEKILEGYKFIAYGIDAVFLYKAAGCPNYEG